MHLLNASMHGPQSMSVDRVGEARNLLKQVQREMFGLLVLSYGTHPLSWAQADDSLRLTLIAACLRSYDEVRTLRSNSRDHKSRFEVH